MLGARTVSADNARIIERLLLSSLPIRNTPPNRRCQHCEADMLSLIWRFVSPAFSVCIRENGWLTLMRAITRALLF